MELNEKIYIKYTLSPISFENPCEKINCTILVEKKKKKVLSYILTHLTKKY